MTFATLWHELSYLGVRPELPLDLRKKIVLCNRIAGTVGVVILFTSFIFVQVPALFLFYLTAALVYASPLLLNAQGWYDASRFILTFLPSVFILVGAGLAGDGPPVSQKLALLSVVIAPLLLFQVNEPGKLAVGVGWALLALLLYEPITVAIPRLDEIPADVELDNANAQTVSSLVSFVLFVAAFVYQQNLNRRTDRELEATFHELETRNQTIGQQNNRLQHQYDEIERQKEAIESINQALRLQALKAQMDPHFIFNALNSIQHFVVQREPKEALDYLSKFSKLIRQVLENSVNETVTVADELKALTHYLDLERLRFNGAFSYEIDVDDDLDPYTTDIPPMLLQPYVENAILHGLRHKTDGPGRLSVHLMNQVTHLLCVVADNGVGRTAAATLKARNPSSHVSRGKAMTDSRLHLLNAGQSEPVSVVTVDLQNETGQPAGTRVEITIPV